MILSACLMTHHGASAATAAGITHRSRGTRTHANALTRLSGISEDSARWCESLTRPLTLQRGRAAPNVSERSAEHRRARCDAL